MNPTELAAIANLVVQLGPLAVTLVEKMASLFNLGSDEKANIAKAIAAAEAADDATVTAVNQWMAANGLPAVAVLPPAPPAA